MVDLRIAVASSLFGFTRELSHPEIYYNMASWLYLNTNPSRSKALLFCILFPNYYDTRG